MRTKPSNGMGSLYCQGEGIAGEKKSNSAEIPVLEVGFMTVSFSQH